MNIKKINTVLLVIMCIIVAVVYSPIIITVLGLQKIASLEIEPIKTICNAIEKLLKVTVKPLLWLLDYTDRTCHLFGYSKTNTSIDNEPSEYDKRLKEMLNDDSYNNFVENNYQDEYTVDGVKFTVTLDDNDYVDGFDLYDAYKNTISLTDTFVCDIDDYIKTFMIAKNITINLVSKTEYAKYHDAEKYAGFFQPKYNDYGVYERAVIYVQLVDDLTQEKHTLYHEIGHFIDLMCGCNEDNLFVSNYESDDNFMINEAFKKEASLIREYAEKDASEFFACAYEHMMMKGDMTNLELTQLILNYVLKKVEALSEKIPELEEIFDEEEVYCEEEYDKEYLYYSEDWDFC